MAIYQQITESSLGWLFTLVWISIFSGSVWTGFALQRHGASRVASAVTGIALFLLQTLVYEMLQRRMLEAVETSEGLETGVQVLVAVLLAVVPLAIPVLAEISLYVLRPKDK